jgi:hypothetical protein
MVMSVMLTVALIRVFRAGNDFQGALATGDWATANKSTSGSWGCFQDPWYPRAPRFTGSNQTRNLALAWQRCLLKPRAHGPRIGKPL